MEEIKRLLPLHKQKWFHTLRTPEYYTNLDNIKRYNIIILTAHAQINIVFAAKYHTIWPNISANFQSIYKRQT